ncbi:MAG: peptidase, m16 (pitrilysin) family, zinc protease [Armatimonadetes bacterium CSP1-3]|nr:MAG: peptidase, m16 (pitrilysin) family, zinc protease [Armatimonadetes bacterium CSP1-3]
MRWTALLLLLALLAPAVSPATAQSRTAAPLRVVLDNGLTVIVQETHATEIVTLQAWVKVGSRDETDETNGAAHFVEHMLFKGTQRRGVGQIDREVEGLGGILNASTSFDYTQYFIVSASRFFDKILGIQSDALMRSTLDPQEFERERLVIIEELNRRDDTPSTRTFDALYTTAYAVHPYRRPIGGSRAVIQQMTRDQLFGFYTTHYAPGNVTVVVVGDVSAQDAVHKVRRAYGGWRRPAPARQQFAPEPPFGAVRRSVIEGDVRVAYLNMGWLGPAARDRDVYAMDVLLYVLGRGRGSRLARSIQEGQRLVQQISAGFPTALDPTLFSVFAVTEPDNVARVEEVILAEIRGVREQGVSDEDLRRAKTLLEGEEIVSTHTTRGFATTLGFYATVADLEFALTYRDRIRQVSREDVQRVALRFLDPQRYALVVLQPRR